MSPEALLRLAGALQVALALLHLSFPRRFDWEHELPRLSLLNRQMFVVHTAFIALLLLMFGSLSLCAPDALLQPTPLARLVLGGLAAFWGLRLFVQCFVYDRRLWRGHAFNTRVHIAFTVLWLYLSATYARVLLLQL